MNPKAIHSKDTRLCMNPKANGKTPCKEFPDKFSFCRFGNVVLMPIGNILNLLQDASSHSKLMCTLDRRKDPAKEFPPRFRYSRLALFSINHVGK